MAIKLGESGIELYPANKCENKIIMNHFLIEESQTHSSF